MKWDVTTIHSFQLTIFKYSRLVYTNEINESTHSKYNLVASLFYDNFVFYSVDFKGKLLFGFNVAKKKKYEIHYTKI